MKIVGHAMWETVRCGIPTLSNGQLQVSGIVVATDDTTMIRSISVNRQDGRKLTKSDQDWFAATVAGLAYGARLESDIIWE